MKNNINPKSYTLIKYLLTISMLFFYLIGILGIVYSIKTKNSINYDDFWVSNYYYLAVVCLFIAIMSAVSYLIIRNYMHKNSGHKFNKKEKIYTYCYSFSFIVVIFFTLIIIFAKEFAGSSLLIVDSVVLFVVFAIGIEISLLETYSRITEQALINKMWFLRKEQEKNEAINETIKENNIEKSENKKVELKDKKDKNPFMEE
ncbi:hypothetical protein SHELI_v1c06060 [Spiroplasma helicoides]|uniref:Transmembrane protein n=1 Tax=Spiroplasma helicoides TaxID=216938 RepID=A0A1B3SKW7_9MOLU|nr:hypothetical protein [Spiroplasma helicoides]AOG60557.1 hypothetical protein SHELI_v1c06060 [Spiroplasma helicoides]